MREVASFNIFYVWATNFIDETKTLHKDDLKLILWFYGYKGNVQNCKLKWKSVIAQHELSLCIG